jgi:hypothetical protein
VNGAPQIAHGDPATTAAPTCSLNREALASRLEDWAALRSRALMSQSREGGAVTSTWSRADGVRAELARLVDAERICCPLLNFEITEEHAIIVLRTTFPEGMPAELWHSIG